MRIETASGHTILADDADYPLLQDYSWWVCKTKAGRLESARAMLKDPLYKALTILRTDALERDMRDLALVYGWALMQRGEQIVMAGLKGPVLPNGEQGCAT